MGLLFFALEFVDASLLIFLGNIKPAAASIQQVDKKKYTICVNNFGY